MSKIVYENFLLLLVYCIAAYVSNTFSNITFTWPLVGISLAILLLKGNSVLPAIFLGGFVVTVVQTGLDSPAAIIFCIASGLKLLMAVCIARYLIDKVVGVENPLIENKSIALFLLLAGPIGMMLPSVFILGVRHWLEGMAPDEFWSNLFLEWLGGSVGVCIFTPLVLVLLGKKIYYSRGFSVVIPLLLLFVLDAWFFNFIKKIERRGLKQSFEQQTKILHDKTANKVNYLVDELHKLKAFVDITENIDRENFKHYSQYIIGLPSDKKVLVWVPLVLHENRMQFESRNNIKIAEYQSNGNIKAATIKKHYFPIQFISSDTLHQSIKGIDINENSRWKAALNRALVNRKAEIISLEQRNFMGKDQKMLSIILPVYHSLQLSKTLGKKSLRGYVMTILPFNSIMDDVLKQAKIQKINFRISGSGFDKEESLGGETHARYDFSHTEQMMKFAYPLQFIYSPNNDFESNNGSLPLVLIFTAGLGLTWLVGFLLLSVTGQNIQTQNKVDEKTKALNTERNLLKTVLNNVQEGIIACDELGTLIVFNYAAEDIFEERLNSKSLEQWIEHADLSDLNGNLLLDKGEGVFDKLLKKERKIKGFEFSISAGGSKKILKASSAFIKQDNHSSHSGAVISFQDVTLNKQYVNELKRLGWAVEYCPVCIVMTDAKGHIEYVNNKFTDLTGYTFHEVRGGTAQIMNPEYMSEDKYQLLWDTISTGKEWRDEVYYKKKNGDCYWCSLIIAPIKDEQQQITHFVSIQEDISEERQAVEILSHQASHDDLTGLLNRRECEKRLDSVIQSANIHQSRHVFCFLDLDKFKIVNDSCGHLAGDHLLREVSGVFHAQLRQRDTLVRLGGDEFGIILEHCTLEQAEVLTDKICQVVADYDFTWEGQLFNIGVSVGLASIDEHTINSTKVIAMADEACYAAKKSGRGRVVFLHPKKSN